MGKAPDEAGVRFSMRCERRWEELEPTQDDATRYCTICKQAVRRCENMAEARAWGGCVAASGVLDEVGLVDLSWEGEVGDADDAGDEAAFLRGLYNFLLPEDEPDEVDLELLAEAGGAFAADVCYEIGMAHLQGGVYSGHRVAADPERAFKWLAHSAELGRADAQFQVAELFLHGDAVDCSEEEARRWYLSAAEHGHVPSMVIIATPVLLGDSDHLFEGVSDAQAAQWLRCAVAAGSPDALKLQSQLERARARAASPDALEDEAFAGNAQAQLELSRRCSEGATGRTRDYQHAYRWLLIASSCGAPVDEARMAELEAKLDPTSLAHQQEIAREVARAIASANRRS